MSSYLVTGAAGFIASKICELLLADGHTILGVDNLHANYDVRIKEYRLNHLREQPNFRFTHLDISDRAAIPALADLLPHPDAVINLAAVAGVRNSVLDPWLYVNTNTTGTLNMLEYARQTGAQKFILASTSSLYGQNGDQPHSETHDTEHPLQPYAASKKGGESMAHAYHYLHGLDVTVFRYFTVYGPAGRPDMSLFRFCQWIAEGREVLVTGDGTQSRGFTYVDDIARGTILGLQPLGYEIINLGGHEVLSINQCIAMLEERLGKKARVRYIPSHKADVLTNVADVTKARQLLGWQPQVSMAKGLTNLVDWYFSNRDWAKDIITD
jgi:nucleoside-diphosphate-sugar epimerase